MTELYNKLEPVKYTLLLISSFLILLTIPIPDDSKGFSFVYTLFTSFNIIAGLVVVGNRKHLRSRIIQLVGVTLLIYQIVILLTPIPHYESILGILFVIFFTSLSVRVYHDIYAARDINWEILAAVFCGFIFLGLLCSFLFVAIEGLVPGSFSGLSSEYSNFDNFVYFSFISLLTIGYGDIVPATALTKAMIIILGLIGNFYTVIVTAIVIGKFLMNYKPNTEN